MVATDWFRGTIMTISILFDPVSLGDLVLPNRIVMAPLTRNRALHDGDVPHALNAQYYEQRASAGLIITEAHKYRQRGKATPGHLVFIVTLRSMVGARLLMLFMPKAAASLSSYGMWVAFLTLHCNRIIRHRWHLRHWLRRPELSMETSL